MTRVDDAQYRESEIQIQTPFKLNSYMHDGKNETTNHENLSI